MTGSPQTSSNAGSSPSLYNSSTIIENLKRKPGDFHLSMQTLNDILKLPPHLIKELNPFGLSTWLDIRLIIR